jgi:hypothetical protein
MIASMRFAFARIPAIAGAAIFLAGCGMADSHANLPKFMREAEPPPRQQDAAPNVKQLVRDNMASIFVASAHPTGIAVSPARRDPHGPGWIACVKAGVSGMSNQPIGIQTYIVFIESGRIWNRHRADADDKCDAESYEPL